MDYIKQTDAFYNRIEAEPLSESAISLWHSLMHINSRTAWAKEFTVPTITLRSKASLSESALRRARKELEKKGYIIVQSRRGNRSPVYEIVCLTVTSDRNINSYEVTVFNKIWQVIKGNDWSFVKSGDSSCSPCYYRIGWIRFFFERFSQYSCFWVK